MELAEQLRVLLMGRRGVRRRFEGRGVATGVAAPASRRTPNAQCSLSARHANSSILVSLVLLATACRPTCMFHPCTSTVGPEAFPGRNDVVGVEVISSETRAERGTEFTLRARLRLTGGWNVLLDGFGRGIIWVAQGASVTANDSGAVVALGSASDSAWVVARYVTHAGDTLTSDTAVVLAYERPGASGSDVLWVPHEPPTFPTVALIDGPTATGWVEDRLVAVVGRADLGVNLRDGQGSELEAFSPRHEGRRYDGATWWTDQPDTIDLTGATGPPKTIHVQAIIGADPEVVRPNIATEFAYANRLFAESRLGVRMEPVTRELGEDLNLPVYWDAACEWLGAPEQNWLGIDVSKDTLYALYFSNWDTATQAYACVYDGQPGVVLLLKQNRAPSDLVHEIGHGFGFFSPALPCDGHASSDVYSAHYGGFDRANVMDPNQLLGDGSFRRYITVGQTYRMLFDSRSFIGRGQVNAKSCAYDPDASAPCPKLALDIAAASVVPTDVGGCPTVGVAQNDDP